MGIDFLDLHCQLERRFGFHMRWDPQAWESRAILGRHGIDYTAWTVAEIVAAKLAAAGRTIESVRDRPGPSTSSSVPPPGVADPPPQAYVAAVWSGVQEAICNTLGCHAIRVTPESRLISDLGFS